MERVAEFALRELGLFVDEQRVRVALGEIDKDETERELARIINFAIEELGLLTSSPASREVLKRFEENATGEETVQYILTSGLPPGNLECRDCRKSLPASMFGFYQARTDKNGYLRRSSALCKTCRGKMDKLRAQIFGDEKDRIPPRPQAGDICPDCQRPWAGNWHRHHEGEKFVRWICGHCNMTRDDQRNPEGYQDRLLGIVE